MYITYKTWDQMNFLFLNVLYVFFSDDFEHLLKYFVGKLSHFRSSWIIHSVLCISWMFIKCSGKLVYRVAFWCLNSVDFSKGRRNF